ncbi:hypothetical protein [uncultured Cytophaga sp.]|uniref:hypothetical protein n=1 Tax=uncultured Cytophaga sp. TaxID=160238 RepID=UPI0026215E88|nr:hypothetical protein [uncultured Cytophaga sp.]
MESAKPRITINFLALALQLVLFFLFYLGFEKSGSDEPALWAAMTYLVLAFGLRYFVPLDYRKGIREMKLENYSEAITYFDKSAIFFSKYTWVDRFRVFTLFSISKLSYREMSELHKAHCLECLRQEKS